MSLDYYNIRKSNLAIINKSSQLNDLTIIWLYFGDDDDGYCLCDSATVYRKGRLIKQVEGKYGENEYLLLNGEKQIAKYGYFKKKSWYKTRQEMIFKDDSLGRIVLFTDFWNGEDRYVNENPIHLTPQKETEGRLNGLGKGLENPCDTRRGCD